MRAWFSVRVLVVGVVVALAYAPFAWLALWFGVELWAILGGVGVALVLQYYLGLKRALHDVATTPVHRDDGRFEAVLAWTRTMAREQGVPEPSLWISDMGSPNAFAVGRKGNGHIVLDVLLFDLLTPVELQAVIAHEVSHLRSRDVIPMVVGSGGAAIAYFLFAIIEELVRTATRSSVAGGLAHATMMAFVCSISREREYIADADSKQAMGSGEPLASALSKIEYVYQQGQTCDPPTGVEAFCIAGHWSLPALGATHPSTQDRVNRLMDNSHQNVVDPPR